jgi:hypothetical protein
VADEAVTTLRAELENFERAEVAFALLETFLEVASPQLGPTVLDPAILELPDEMTDDRAVVRKLIDEINAEPPRPRSFLRSSERTYDVADEQARWDFTRLAYCSNLATVWSPGSRTTYFEVSNQAKATYWLPDTLKALYFEAIAAKGWAIPEDWLAAVPKRPKSRWRRF